MIEFDGIDENNVDIFIQRMRSYPSLIKFLPPRLINYENVTKIVEVNGLALEHVPTFMIDLELCKKSIVENPDALQFVPNRFQHNDFSSSIATHVINHMMNRW
jgi:hypothetical protein